MLLPGSFCVMAVECRQNDRITESSYCNSIYNIFNNKCTWKGSEEYFLNLNTNKDKW